MGAIVEMAQEILVAGEKSDQEYINEGAALVKLAGRGLGEWFNRVKGSRAKPAKSGNIPDLSTKQICDAIPDLKYNTAQTYGLIVEAFPTVASQRGFQWGQCIKMLPVRNKIGAEAFDKWHYNASVGICPESDPDPDYAYTDTKPERLSGKDLSRQIALAKGDKLDVKSDKVEDVTSTALALDTITPVVETHCKTKKSQRAVISAVQKEVKRIEKDVRGHFIDEVNAAADTIAEQRTEELREAAEIQRKASIKAREEYERKSKVTAAMQNRLPMFMTKKEFKLIQGCLHSDRIPEDMKGRFDDAFVIFNRLAEGGDW